MRLFSRRGPEEVRSHQWGDPDDPDTRTRDVVSKLSYEVTRLKDVTEQLQDLVASFSLEVNEGQNKNDNE